MAEVKQYTITEPWLDTQCKLGEAPFWDSASNTLRFLDIVKQELYTVDLSKGASSMTKTDTKVSMSTTANIKGNRDELIFAGKNGYGIMNKTTQTTRMLKQYWGDDEVSQRREQRLTSNDGLVDPAGRYIVGTMNDRQMFKEPMAEGVVVSLSSDGSVQHIMQNVTIPNGMSFSQDGKTIYMTDSTTGKIRQYPYDLSTGKVDATSGKDFFTCPYEGEFPDGHCRDADGCFWIAIYGGWRVVRISPEAKLLAEVKLPTRCITCPAICGTTLYITSAAEEAPEQHPESVKYQGAVFKLDIGVGAETLHEFKLS